MKNVRKSITCWWLTQRIIKLWSQEGRGERQGLAWSSVFWNMEARTQGGRNAGQGVSYSPSSSPCRLKLGEQKERTIHYGSNLVNRRKREEDIREFSREGIAH